MSVKENVRFDGQKKEEIRQPMVFPKIPRVDLNNLMKKVREEENKNKRNKKNAGLCRHGGSSRSSHWPFNKKVK